MLAAQTHAAQTLAGQTLAACVVDRLDRCQLKRWSMRLKVMLIPVLTAPLFLAGCAQFPALDRVTGPVPPTKLPLLAKNEVTARIKVQ